MSENVISVPSTIQFYFENTANSSAINHILANIDDKSNKKNIEPLDFDWEDLKNFYQAYLSAKKTQVDYWLFKLEAWNNIWGKLLKREYGLVEKKPSFYENENKLEYVWDEGTLYKAFNIYPSKNTEVVLGLYEENGSLALFMYYLDAESEYKSNEMVLGNYWQGTPDDDTRYTLESINVPIVGDTLNLQPLCEAAQQAVDELERCISKCST